MTKSILASGVPSEPNLSRSELAHTPTPKWTSVLQTGGNRFIIRSPDRVDVASISTKVDGAAKYAAAVVYALNSVPALVKALEEIEAQAVCVVIASDNECALMLQNVLATAQAALASKAVQS